MSAAFQLQFQYLAPLSFFFLANPGLWLATYSVIIRMALQYTVSKNGLQLLQQSLGLQPSESRGPDEIVFVAIDFEYLSNLQ